MPTSTCRSPVPRSTPPAPLAWAVLAALVAGAPAHANGLADLKGALARLQGQAPLKASVELKAWRRSGEGASADEEQGSMTMALEDSPRGLAMQLPRDLLNRHEAEQRALLKDPKARTPAKRALGDFKPTDLLPLTNAAATLARQVEEGSFKGERSDTLNGQAARVLTFEYTTARLSERERSHVKKFDNQMEVWVAADGTPLQAKSRLNASGRAFMVFSFETKAEDDRQFATVGDRLVVLKREQRSSSNGTAGNNEQRTTLTLQPQS